MRLLFLTLLLVAAVSAGITRRRTTTTTTTTATPTKATTPSTIVLGETNKEEVEEERRVGVNGWLAAPTQAPKTSPATSEPPPKSEKAGVCDSPKGYGIKCMSGLDQCSHDNDCPAAAKCCMVGECGKLCVKPKPTSTETKEATKASPPKKNKKEGNKRVLADTEDEVKEVKNEETEEQTTEEIKE